MINPSEQVNFQDLVSRIAAEGRVEELSQQLVSAHHFSSTLLVLWIATVGLWALAIAYGLTRARINRRKPWTS